MECIYAIALYASTASQFMNRLAIVSTGVSYPYSRYALYQAPGIYHISYPAIKSPYLFPHFSVLNEEPSIFMTHDYYDSPNTYVTVYCSLELSRLEMEKKIVRGLLPITPINPHLSRGNRESEKRCLAYITRLSQEKRATLISSSELIAWHDCSERIIASLAYQNMISVVGDYNKFAPQNSCRPSISVNADLAFQMRNLISDDEFFVANNNSPQPSALAWYQGHLHIFARSPRGNLWRPITKLGREERNAFEIIKWLEDNDILQSYLSFKEKFEKKMSSLDEHNQQLFDKHKLRYEDRILLASSFAMIKIGELAPSGVTGQIGQNFDVP